MIGITQNTSVPIVSAEELSFYEEMKNALVNDSPDLANEKAVKWLNDIKYNSSEKNERIKKTSRYLHIYLEADELAEQRKVFKYISNTLLTDAKIAGTEVVSYDQ